MGTPFGFTAATVAVCPQATARRGLPQGMRYVSLAPPAITGRLAWLTSQPSNIATRG